jgi:Mg2+ and Co2+ transporter CorA
MMGVSVTWIHLVNPEQDQLETAFGKSIHPQALRNALRVRHFRDRVFSSLLEHDGYLFGELAFPAQDDVPFDLEVVGLRVIADHERVVTVLHEPTDMPDNFGLPEFEHLVARSADEGWGSGQILWHVLEALTTDVHEQLDEAQRDISSIEDLLTSSESAIDDHTSFRNRLSTLRRLFNDVGETIPPVVEICEQISDDQLDLRSPSHDGELFPRELEIYVMDVLLRLRHALARARYGLQEVDVLQDTYASILDREQVKAGNRTAGVANMLLWPTLIVGFYGMNIDPEYFGEMSFLNGPILMALLALLVGGLYWKERRRW